MLGDFLGDVSEKEVILFRELLLADYELYSQFAFKCLTGSSMSVEFHHNVICEFIQKIIDGEIVKGIITIPPRHGKTLIATVCLISRSFAGNNQSKNIQTSFSYNNVNTNSEQIQTIITHPSFIRVFGEIKFNSKAKGKFSTIQGGECFNVTSKGAVTGAGAGLTDVEGFSGALVMDDMIKPDEASSATVTAKINNRYTETLSNRVNDGTKTPQLLIMQRLGEEDLVNYLLTGQHGDEWHYLNIPAVVSSNTGSAEWYERICKKYTHAIPYLYTPNMEELITKNLTHAYTLLKAPECSLETFIDNNLEDYLAKDKAVLWAVKMTLKSAELTQKARPSYFATQYMGEPSVRGGTIFKTSWFKECSGWHTFKPEDIKRVRIYVDAASKAQSHNDRTVFTAWAETPKGIHLIKGIAFRKEIEETCEEFFKFYDEVLALKNDYYHWQIDGAWVEDAAAGISIIQKAAKTSKYKVNAVSRAGTNVEKNQFCGNKFVRADRIINEVFSGNVYLDPNLAITKELLSEAEQFSADDTHPHDDVVDCLIDAVQDMLVNNGSGGGLVDDSIYEALLESDYEDDFNWG